MSSYLATLNHALASFGPAFANHLWQSTAFAAGAWLLTLALRRNQARVRHAVWLAASGKFLIPFSLLIAAGNLLPHPRQAIAPVVYSAMDGFEEPFAEIALPPPAPLMHTPTMGERLEAVLPATLAAIWLVGAGVVLVVWASRWRIVRRTLRAAEPAHEGREFEILRQLEAQITRTGLWVAHSSRALRAMSGERDVPRRKAVLLPLRLSAERMEPGIFGVGRPMLVWPRELSARLDDEHIEAIIAHELAHVRRRDNLTAALHMLVETVFWFHPLVWWMERQMVAEREQACDEAVVALVGEKQTGDAETCDQTWSQTYAEALLKTCRFCIESPLACVSGVTGADLKQRVVGIVTGRALLRMSWPKKLLLAAAAVCVIAAPIVLGQAKSAQRLMLAAINAAPRPLQTAAHAMMAEGETPSNGEIADASPASVPGSALDPCSTTQGAKFDVVSIKPSKASSGDWDSETNADGVSLSGTTKALIQEAFGLRDFQVIGGPDWIAFDTFDIKAKFDVPEKPGDQAAEKAAALRWTQRYRSLLQEQFQFRCHMATKELPVYDLVVAKGGAKLKTASVDSNGESTDGHGDAHKIQVIGTSVGMEHMVGMFARYSGRTVVDKTGLTGKYDFTLNWSTQRQADQNVQDGEPSLPELPTALEEQLGLKLVPSKGPVPVLVIDYIEKPAVDGAEVQQLAASAANAKWIFDAASIKVQDPNERMIMGPNGTTENFQAEGVTVQTLVAYAYDLPWTQGLSASSDSRYLYNAHSPTLVGDPTWASNEQYDLTAKADPAVTEIWKKLPPDEQKKRLKEMVQAMLADRFQLRVHHETRELPVYALVVAKGGPKLTASAPDPPATPDDPDHPKPYHSQWQSDLGLIGGHGITMEQLAQALWSKREIGSKKVIDRTGLTGKYDFRLKWTPEGDPDDAGGVSLFTAIQEQLGLKLEPIKGPADVLVIDHVERPSEN